MGTMIYAHLLRERGEEIQRVEHLVIPRRPRPQTVGLGETPAGVLFGLVTTCPVSVTFH